MADRTPEEVVRFWVESGGDTPYPGRGDMKAILADLAALRARAEKAEGSLASLANFLAERGEAPPLTLPAGRAIGHIKRLAERVAALEGALGESIERACRAGCPTVFPTAEPEKAHDPLCHAHRALLRPAAGKEG